MEGYVYTTLDFEMHGIFREKYYWLLGYGWRLAAGGLAGIGSTAAQPHRSKQVSQQQTAVRRILLQAAAAKSKRCTSHISKSMALSPLFLYEHSSLDLCVG